MAARIIAVLALAGLIVVGTLVLSPQEVQRASAAGPVQMSLNVTSPLGHCDDPQEPTKCDLPLGTSFQVAIVASSPPAGGYDSFDTTLFFGDLEYEPTFFATGEIVWPESVAPARVIRSRTVLHGSTTAAQGPRPVSNYQGNLVDVTFRCPQTAEKYPLALLVAGSTYSRADFPNPPKTSLQSALDLAGDGDVEVHDLAALIEVNCVAGPTFTPTATPTGPTPTPTSTATLAPTPAGDASMSLDVEGGSCDLPSKPTVCSVPVGTAFDVGVVVNERPPEGYIGLQALVLLDGLIYKPAPVPDEIVWPDATVEVRALGFPDPELSISYGAATKFIAPRPVSTYTGRVVEFTLTCPPILGTHVLILEPFSDSPQGTSFQLPRAVGDPQLSVSAGPDSISIDCVEAPPVGGVALEPDVRELALEAEGGNVDLLAGAVAVAAAMVLALGGAAAHARRRVDR